MKINKSICFIYCRLLVFFPLLFFTAISFSQTLSNAGEKEAINSVYANLNNWAAHPSKKDPSDSIPQFIRNKSTDEIKADVFFIHPTSYTSTKKFGWNAPLDDSILNHETDFRSILYQASVFNGSCRIYAPRYRQVHLDGFYSDSNEVRPYFDLAYDDVKKAFEYYLKYENHGRPIIIASHSQGTVHAARLLKEFFEGKELIKQLVCAYLIGMPIPENFYSCIEPCRDSTSTGCFVSWRTFKDGYIPEFIKEESFKCVVVNPLNWNMEETFVDAKENKGGMLMNFEKLIPYIVSTRIKGNILWSSKPNIFGKIFIFKKNFHIADYNLFYMNIRENVACRIKRYLIR